MSDKYLKTFGDTKITREQMRVFVAPPLARRDSKGKIEYITEQSHKQRCDINHIIRRFQKTGILEWENTLEMQYGDTTGHDFKTMMDTVTDVQSKFNRFPLEIRERFHNDPSQYFEFMQNAANRQEAIKLGLITPSTPAEKDGLGEHATEPIPEVT